MKQGVQQRGQGMTEYIVIVALIAVAAIAVYQFFGQTIRSQTAGIALEVAGKDGSKTIGEAGKAADNANKDIGVKGLDAYGSQNKLGGGGGGGGGGGE